jgi:homoserine O-acetyltransferase
MLQSFELPGLFTTSQGAAFPLRIGYTTHGQLNAAGDNVVWICHALTASSDPADWWPGFVGAGCVINPQEHFIVCANVIGSCYGTTGPLDINPETGTPWLRDFPLITIRDLVQAHIALREHLGIERIALLAGGSMGGYQAQEWALTEPERIDRLLLLATSAAESAWGVAIHTAQRMAIEASPGWASNDITAAAAGLKAARAIGMLSYRNYALFAAQQDEPDPDKTDGLRAESYIRYQGEKLAQRFNAFSYWSLTRTMDSHNISRGRGPNTGEALRNIVQPTLIIGISSDILCPVAEQEHLAAYIPAAQLEVIESPYGHDGFLVEAPAISALLRDWWR